MGSGQKWGKSLTQDALTSDKRAENESVNSSDGLFRKALNLLSSLLNCVYLILRSTPFVTRILTHICSSDWFPAQFAESSSFLMNSENEADKWKNEAFPVEVLWKIFGRSETLSPRELLGCRSVCKTWRDAATSFLLNQNCCQVVLNYKVTGTGSEEENVTFTNARQPLNSVSELTQLLSSSPAFPSTSIRFHAEIKDDVFGDLSVSSGTQEKDEGRRELLRLFSLHGSKFKSLALPHAFPAKALQNIFYEHAPNLECLDLGEFDRFFESSDDVLGDDTILRHSLSQDSHLYLGLNEIIWKLIIPCVATRPKLFNELLQISPKLSKIHNVNVSTLEMLLEEKKSHLAYSLKFFVEIFDGMCVAEEVGNLLKGPLYSPNVARSALSELIVNFALHFTHQTEYQRLIAVLNSILEWSKDTLQYLSLTIVASEHLDCKIKFPSMANLVTMELVEDSESWSHYGWDYSNGFESCFIGKTYFDEDIAATCIYNWNLFQFEYGSSYQSSRVPYDYFPRLRKVQLSPKRDISSWEKLVAFFALDRLGEITEEASPSVIPGDRVQSVTELEMSCFVLGSDKLSKLFPNISILTITHPCQLRNTVWTTFPLLKKFEILEDPKNSKKSTSAIDSFFTGIPENLCVRFASEEPVKVLGLSSAQVHKFRTEPCIGNCQNLAELKINFKTKLETTFGSKLCAVYGLQELGPQTRIVFLFKSLELNEADVADMRRLLAPLISPYVQLET